MLKSAAFVRDYIEADDWWTGHSWSLSIEEQFYLLWPVALVLMGLRRIKEAAIRLIILAPAVRILTAVIWRHSSAPIALMFHTRMDGLMCGCVLALMREEKEFSEKSRRFLNWRLAVFAGLVLFFVSTVLFWRYGEMYWLAVGSSLENLCISYLLLYTVEFPQSIAGRFLNFGAVAHVGKISYSFYLWQQVFLTVLNKSVLGIFPLNVIAALGTAEISWWLIEKPSLALRLVLERRHPAQVAVAGTGH